MLRISKLTVQNFGPYHGKQSLTFSESDGVTIIWGDNGYGKTSIMNAFRYVLWGNLFGRKRQCLQPYTFVNLPSLVDGEDMLVELYMNYNGKDCIVSRGLHRVGGDGKSAEDYEAIFKVKVDSMTLNKDESNEFLATAFPDRISRFYLFDGELLGEYEDLLDEQDESGAKIKESIEDILGIPILENARKNVESIRSGFNKEATNLAKKEESTEKISADYDAAVEELEHVKESKESLGKQLGEARSEERQINDLMAANTTFSGYVSQKNEKEKTLKSDKDSLDRAKEKIVPYMDGAWKDMLNPVINDAIQCLDDSIADIREKENNGKSLVFVSEYIASHLANHPHHCPICDNSLSSSLQEEILSHFRKDKLLEITADEKEQLDAAASRITMLKRCLSGSSKGEISILLDQIDTLTIAIDLTLADIDDIKSKIEAIGSSASEDEVRELPQRLTNCMKKIGEIKKGIDEADEHITDINAAIEKLDLLLQKNAKNPDVKIAKTKERFTSHLGDLFEESISQFRDKLKVSVESDASVFFKAISNDPDYDHLAINESYGLQIVGSDGQIVPHRSSGYEQVVAISLISALHKNAPIEGPIFMDSTFQRVDGRHKQKIIKNLHTFGHQVIVLAYYSEMGDVAEVKASLGTHLLKEYRLNHKTSMETTIE